MRNVPAHVGAGCWANEFAATKMRNVPAHVSSSRMEVGAGTSVLLYLRKNDDYTKQSAGFWGVRGCEFLMILGKNANDTGFEVKDMGFEANDAGFEANDMGFEANDMGFEANDTGFEVKDTGVRRIERGNREMRQTAPPRKPRMGLRARVAT